MDSPKNTLDVEKDFSEALIVNDIMQANSQNFEYRYKEWKM